MSISDIHALSKAYYELDELNRKLTDYRIESDKIRKHDQELERHRKSRSFFNDGFVRKAILELCISNKYSIMKQEIKDKEDVILALKRKAFENIDWHELYPSNQDKSYDDWISQAQHDYRISQIQH